MAKGESSTRVVSSVSLGKFDIYSSSVSGETSTSHCVMLLDFTGCARLVTGTRKKEVFCI